MKTKQKGNDMMDFTPGQKIDIVAGFIRREMGRNRSLNKQEAQTALTMLEQIRKHINEGGSNV